MAVTTGPALYPSATTFPSSSTYPGQGDRPLYRVLLSASDASESTPQWQDVGTRLRGFSVTRGRPSELDEMDAGNLTMTLDNRDRAFDPEYTSSPFYPNLRPMNRVWVRADWSGSTYDLFKGYVESYQREWPSFDKDRIVNVKAVDEFKVLASGNLPVTEPPRGSYHEVVEFDTPSAYWRMGTPSPQLEEQPVIGPLLSVDVSAGGGMGSTGNGAIVGEVLDENYAALSLPATCYLRTPDLAQMEAPGLGWTSAFTVEFWLRATTTPAGGQYLLTGPNSASGGQWSCTLDPSGVVTFNVWDNVPTLRSVVTSSPVVDSRWHHVLVKVDSGTLYMYLDGVQQTTSSFGSYVQPSSLTAGSAAAFVGSPTSTNTVELDELAVYRYALNPQRVLAHYTAGASRGFPRSQVSGPRVDAILDAATSRAPRDIDAGVRILTGSYMTGQAPLSEMQATVRAESGDALMFAAGDGTLVFRDSDHRASAPYNTVQATFGDQGGTERPYRDITVDYSESFLFNSWTVTREAGKTTTTSEDATSIGRYFKRSQSITDLKVTTDSDVTAIAAALLAKYKDPFTRVTSLTPKTSDPDTLADVLSLDLADRIRVLRSPTYTGTRVDQQLFVQGIEFAGEPAAPFPDVKFTVSPV